MLSAWASCQRRETENSLQSLFRRLIDNRTGYPKRPTSGTPDVNQRFKFVHRLTVQSDHQHRYFAGLASFGSQYFNEIKTNAVPRSGFPSNQRSVLLTHEPFSCWVLNSCSANSLRQSCDLP